MQKLKDTKAQHLNERGDELKEGISKLIAKLLDTYHYKDEEISSSHTYPTEYEGPNPIDEQIKVIAEIFELDPTQALEYAKDLPKLPNDAEGWFAIPKIEALAQKHFPDVTAHDKKYHCAVRLVYKKIASLYSSNNYGIGNIESANLQICTRTTQALTAIDNNQPGDILIIAAQLGMSH